MSSDSTGRESRHALNLRLMCTVCCTTCNKTSNWAQPLDPHEILCRLSKTEDGHGSRTKEELKNILKSREEDTFAKNELKGLEQREQALISALDLNRLAIDETESLDQRCTSAAAHLRHHPTLMCLHCLKMICTVCFTESRNWPCSCKKRPLKWHTKVISQRLDCKSCPYCSLQIVHFGGCRDIVCRNCSRSFDWWDGVDLMDGPLLPSEQLGEIMDLTLQILKKPLEDKAPLVQLRSLIMQSWHWNNPKYVFPHAPPALDILGCIWVWLHACDMDCFKESFAWMYRSLNLVSPDEIRASWDKYGAVMIETCMRKYPAALSKLLYMFMPQAEDWVDQETLLGLMRKTPHSGFFSCLGAMFRSPTNSQPAHTFMSVTLPREAVRDCKMVLEVADTHCYVGEFWRHMWRHLPDFPLHGELKRSKVIRFLLSSSVRVTRWAHDHVVPAPVFQSIAEAILYENSPEECFHLAKQVAVKRYTQQVAANHYTLKKVASLRSALKKMEQSMFMTVSPDRMVEYLDNL